MISYDLPKKNFEFIPVDDKICFGFSRTDSAYPIRRIGICSVLCKDGTQLP